MIMLTQTELQRLLHYDPLTGVFTWLVNRPGRKAGTVAGSFKVEGYRRISISDRKYTAHRLAWLYMTGEWPTSGVDHEDGDPANNVFTNLRDASPAENAQNMKPRRNTSSGYRGVTKFRTKWQAQIEVAGKSQYLGLFNTPEEAHEAYLVARAKFYAFQPTPRKV